jgi:hypothetical protein
MATLQLEEVPTMLATLELEIPMVSAASRCSDLITRVESTVEAAIIHHQEVPMMSAALQQ